jgi:SAM-dependent methyltransferase
MAKQGEIEYLRKIGAAGVRHAVGKPFTDPYCPAHLMQIGAVMLLLPPPPARLLDLGCGTGWTSLFFGRRGYDVVGADIAPDMIEHANRLRDHASLDNLRFAVRDYEEMAWRKSGSADGGCHGPVRGLPGSAVNKPCSSRWRDATSRRRRRRWADRSATGHR